MVERLSPNRVSEPDPGVERLSIADAGPKVEALRSRTARSTVAELGREPATATDLADRADTSLLNVGYHLSRLEDAGLVTVAGTRYSEKGAEVTVYERAVAALVLGGSAPPDGGRVSRPSADDPPP